jgi:tRNA A37 threonylcarbamoyladenosine biosynthesis protein TsaE
MEEHDYCFIEWPNFAEYYADDSRHMITIEYDPSDENSRLVTISSHQKKL